MSAQQVVALHDDLDDLVEKLNRMTSDRDNWRERALKAEAGQMPLFNDDTYTGDER